MVVLTVIGIAGLSVVGWVVSTAASAPAITTLKERDPGSNTEVLAADGTRLGFISADELSRPVSGDDLPQVLKDATVAIEDERFYKHEGVDLKMDYARDTLRNIYKIWTRPVHLETAVDDKRRQITFDGKDFGERKLD